jgi:haloacetate dehalogenase
LGPLDSWYPEGPVELWRGWADEVDGHAMQGGHFFPEAAPEPTAGALGRFFASAK